MPGRIIRYDAPAAGPESAEPRVQLEIVRGRARHKMRQVPTRAFLIGTATDCDLVLGAPAFPAVHAYVLRSAQSVTIRWLGEGPELLVNGHVALESSPLADRDLVKCGPYEFRFHIRWPQPQPLGDAEPARSPIPGPVHEDRRRSSTTGSVAEQHASAGPLSSHVLRLHAVRTTPSASTEGRAAPAASVGLSGSFVPQRVAR
jgi:type III secretion system (T3SS) inner membrane Yop/YscD-like protein